MWVSIDTESCLEAAQLSIVVFAGSPSSDIQHLSLRRISCAHKLHLRRWF